MNIIYNHRCNDKVLPHKPPYHTTCCHSYSVPSFEIFGFFAVFVLFVAALAALYYYRRPAQPGSDGWVDNGDHEPVATKLPLPLRLVARVLPRGERATALLLFMSILAMMYICDRTQVFPKIHKNFDSSTFAILVVISLLGALAALTRGDKS
ncbi:hypothetical protein EV182_008947, partial [Spiromyces aspiralis]